MKGNRLFRIEKGRLWYSRKAERTLFFYGTVVMMAVWGLGKLF